MGCVESSTWEPFGTNSFDLTKISPSFFLETKAHLAMARCLYYKYLASTIVDVLHFGLQVSLYERFRSALVVMDVQKLQMASS